MSQKTLDAIRKRESEKAKAAKPVPKKDTGKS